MTPRKVPRIQTALPGPNAQKLIQQDEAYTSPSYTRIYPLVVDRASGTTIEDVDGNLFLDFTAGIAVVATGHCHPNVVNAIHYQSSKLIHMSGTDFYYKAQGDLAQKFAEISPGSSRKKVLFTNSGAEAVEAAFKLARYHTKRQHMIAFIGAFHGRTLGALSLTGSKIVQVESFAPLVPEVTHIGYGYCYRCPYNLVYKSCEIACVTYLEETLFKTIVSPKEVAAIIVEPIQGEGGYIVPPPEYHPMLKKICEKYDILYIVDEVQTGMGRTGKMFAIEHWGVEPDMICLAKGIASGMPLGALIAREDVMTWVEGSHASTFGGNPVSCAASLETIRLLEQGLIQNAKEVGEQLLAILLGLKEKHPWMGDVRGKGLMVGVEIVKNRSTKEKAPQERNAIIQGAFQKGLLLLSCGESAIRFSPPLVVTQEEVKTACEIFDQVLAALEKGRKP